MLSTYQPPVNLLPAAPEETRYVAAVWGDNAYHTTGCFALDSEKRTVKELCAVTSLIVDCDLYDFWTSQLGGQGDKKAMYAALANDQDWARAMLGLRTAIVSVLPKALATQPGAPQFASALVSSGWGWHLYFHLDTPAAGEAIRDARRANALLVRAVNDAAGYTLADPKVHDAGTRLLRTPGTENHKAQGNPKKVEFMWCAPTNQWSLSDILATAEATKEDIKKKPALSNHSATTSSALAWLSSRNHSIRKALSKAREEQDSEADWAIAAQMAMANVPPSFTAMVLEEIRAESEHAGTDYAERTANKAWAHYHGEEYDEATDYKAMSLSALLAMSPHKDSYGAARIIATLDHRLNTVAYFDERIKLLAWRKEKKEEVYRLFDSCHGTPPAARYSRIDWGDAESRLITEWVGTVYGLSLGCMWREAMAQVATGLPRVNPLIEYLSACGSALPEDTDSSILSTWLTHTFGCSDTALNRVIARKWLMSAVARAESPGIFTKGALILTTNGGQSIGKSTALSILGGEWYTELSSRDLSSKDAIMNVHYSWLIELGEMSAIRKSTIEDVKMFITCKEDRFRPPYGSAVVAIPRSCVYAGTANKKDIINDPTGSDRWWCVETPSTARVDFVWLEQNRDMLWGLAWREWMKVKDLSSRERVEAINLTVDELAMLRESNKEFSEEDSREDIIIAEAQKLYIQLNRPISIAEMAAQPGLSGEELMRRGVLSVLDPRREALFRNALTRKNWRESRTRVDGRALRGWSPTGDELAFLDKRIMDAAENLHKVLPPLPGTKVGGVPADAGLAAIPGILAQYPASALPK